MVNFILRFWANSIALLIVVLIIPGIKIVNLETALLTALVLGLLNTFLKPFLLYLTLPLSIFTLGLFTLIINACLFYFPSTIIKGFMVANFWSAFWGAILFSIFSAIINFIINPKGNIQFKSYNYYTQGASHSHRRGKDVIDVEGKVIKQKDKT